jgi:hypothetical protein
MEWLALLAFLLCLVYLPKFRKVMMWIGIVGGGLGAVALGVWKIKDHYDQKRVAEVERQQEEKNTRELEQIRQKAARGEPLTDLDMALLEGGKPFPPGFVPDPVQPKRMRLTPEELAGSTVVSPPKATSTPFDPDKYLREKRRQKKDQTGEWEVVPDQKAP